MSETNSSEKIPRGRVLVFTDWYLPGFRAGGPVTSIANIVQQFRGEIDFRILTTNCEYGMTQPYEGVPYDRWVDRGENLRVFYTSAARRGIASLRAAALSADCDTWYITGVYSLRFSILPLLFARRVPGLRVVVAPRGMLSAHAIGVKRLKKQVFLTVARIVQLYKGVVFQATNSREAEDIAAHFPRNEVILAPNLPRPVTTGGPMSVKKEAGSLKLVFVGRVAPEKNTLGAVKALLDFARGKELIYKNSTKQIELRIYGQIYNEAYWSSCQEVIAQLPENISVKQMGAISPELLPQAIGEAHFLLLPSAGENYGHAIVEALTCGRPVIISDQTPWNGVEAARAGWAIRLEEPERFAGVVAECVQMGQGEYEQWCRAAFEFGLTITGDSVAYVMHKRIFAR
jgi:glycosyltransferase involved in cell wall biosynthesis